MHHAILFIFILVHSRTMLTTTSGKSLTCEQSLCSIRCEFGREQVEQAGQHRQHKNKNRSGKFLVAFRVFLVLLVPWYSCVAGWFHTFPSQPFCAFVILRCFIDLYCSMSGYLRMTFQQGRWGQGLAWIWGAGCCCHVVAHTKKEETGQGTGMACCVPESLPTLCPCQIVRTGYE